MAECLITAGFTGPSCDDTFNVPGIEKDKIYVGNKSEITAFTSSVTGEIDGVTFDTYKGLYALTVHKDTASWSEELQVGTNSGYYYNTSLTFRTIDSATAVRNASRATGISDGPAETTTILPSPVLGRGGFCQTIMRATSS